MRFYLILLFVLANYSLSNAQISNYPYIDIDFEGVEEITIGDKIFLKGDPDEYTFTSIGKTHIPLIKMGRQQNFCLCKTKSYSKDISSYKKYSHCDKSGFFSKIKSKIEYIEESDYWERVAKHPLNTLVAFEQEGKTQLGVVSYISPFSDQLEVSVAKNWGEPKTYIVNPDQLKDKPELNSMSQSDSIQYIFASLSWNRKQHIYNDEFPNIGNVLLNEGETLQLHKPDVKNLYTNEWCSLKSKYRRNGDYGIKKYKDFLNSYWRYDNGVLKIWEVGNVAEVLIEDPETDQKEKENILELELELRVKEITPNTITYILERKNCQTYLSRQKPKGTYGPEYSFDSVYITPYKNEVIRFGDVVTLKNDANTYFVSDLGSAVSLTKVNKNDTDRIMLSNFYERLDKVVDENYKGIVDIKRNFPIYSKIDLGEGNVGYIRSIDYFKQEILFVTYTSIGIKNETISINQVSRIKHDVITPSDTIARVMNTQYWRPNSRLFKYHSYQSGKIIASIGDTITYRSPNYDGMLSEALKRNKKKRKKKDREKDVGEHFKLKYNNSSLEYSGYDISNNSKANLEMKGGWALENDILTLSMMGHSMTWAPLKQDRSSKLKADNKWKHILKLKIIDLSDNHISFLLTHKESELIYKLPTPQH